MPKNFRLLVLFPLAALLAGPALAEPPRPRTEARFILMDAEKDERLGELKDGMLNLSELPTKRLNIAVEFPQQPQAVIFRLNSSRRYRQETAAPFALAGNNGKDFHAWTPKLGKTTIEAAPQQGGRELPPAVLHLEVIDAKPGDSKHRSTALQKAAATPAQPQGRARLKASLRAEETSAAQQVTANKNILFELNGSQAVPPSTSQAKGKCVAILNDAKTLLNVVCTHTVANPSVAKLYRGAAGSPGSEVCELGPPASPIVRNCELSPDLLSALGQGSLYVQIHSGEFPDGEVRGQVQ